MMKAAQERERVEYILKWVWKELQLIKIIY